MKRLLFFLICILATFDLFSQSLFLGLRHNQFGYLENEFKNGLVLGYEQSLMRVEPQYQSAKLIAGYSFKKSTYSITTLSYYRCDYGCDWYNTGLNLDCGYEIGRFKINILLNPHFDSALEYKTCIGADLLFGIWNDISCDDLIELSASIGNLPEYRDYTPYFRLGIKFSSGNVMAFPEISLPNFINNGYDHLRVLCSLGYTFRIGRRHIKE